MKTKQIIPSIDPEGLLMKCNVNYILMFFQNKLLVNQKCKLVADMMNGWMGMCAHVRVRVRVCVCVCMYIACTQLISPVQFFVAPWTVAHQALCSWVFSRQEYRSGLPFPPPGDLPKPGIKPVSLESPTSAGKFFTSESHGKYTYIYIYL